MASDSNEVVLLQFVMNIFNDAQHQSDYDNASVNGSTSSTTVHPSQLDETEQEELLLLMPIWAYQSAGVYLIFISVVGLLLNILIVIVILNDPQRMTSLNWMLLNLACCDGTIAGFGTTISTVAAFQFSWPFSDELCVAYAMIMSTAGICSITTLTALALWRCLLVVYCPAKRSRAFAIHHSSGGRRDKLSRVQAAILLTLIWAYSLAVTCPPLFGWGRYDREAAHISCSVNWESKMDNNRSYILYMFVFGLFVPFIVIVISYVSILRVVKKTGRFKRATQQQQQKDHRLTTDLQEVKQHNVNNNKQPARNNKTQSDAAERRVTVMVACMIGAFLAAWTPYSIMALFETFIGDGGHSGNEQTNVSSSVRQPEEEEKENFVNYVGTISPAFATIPAIFAKTSAILNPLIYGILNTQFRSACEKIISRFLGLGRGPSSQDADGSGNETEKRRHRGRLELLEFSFTLKPSMTVNLPMKEIAPLIDDSQNFTDNQQKISSFKNSIDAPANSPVTSSQTRSQHQSDDDQNPKTSDELCVRKEKYRETVNPFVDPAAGPSNSKFPINLSKNSNRNLIATTRQEQPKLVVVRLLSDSTSYCYTTDETSVDISHGRVPIQLESNQ